MISKVLGGLMFAAAVFSVSLDGSAAFAADAKVCVKVPVRIDHIHPDVQRAWMSCSFFDTNGKKIDLFNLGATNLSYSANKDRVEVGASRSINTTLENCWQLDEQLALKQLNWDRYRCPVTFVTSSSQHEITAGNPGSPWSVRPGGQTVSEGKFNLYAQ